VENIVRENEKLRILNENLKTEIHENLNTHKFLQENTDNLQKKTELLELNNEENRKEILSLKDEKGDYKSSLHVYEYLRIHVCVVHTYMCVYMYVYVFMHLSIQSQVI
jgi:hypothetical protein